MPDLHKILFLIFTVEPVSICTMKLYPVIEIETGIEQWTYEQPDCQMERNLRNLDHESVALNDELLGDEFMPLMDRKGNAIFGVKIKICN